MDIVFIGPFGLSPKGTMSARAVPLAKALVQRGHQVTILIPPWDNPERAGQQWDDAGVRIVNVPLPRLRLPVFFHILLTRTLVQAALARRPQVIHLFKPKAYAGLAHLMLYYAQRHTSRLVVDSDDWEQAWNEVLPYSPLHKWFFAWQERWGLRHADAVTVASRALVDLVTAEGQLQFVYLPNGTESPFPARPLEAIHAVRERWHLGEAPVILLYTRFAEFRLSRIVTLVRRVAEAVPAAIWLIIGQGFQREEDRLATILADTGLSDRVRLAGWPVDDLAACVRAAQVAVYPYDDTVLNKTKCSVKLIDLLAAGLPVVADAVGQNCAYIKTEITGLLTPPEDDAAFAQAVIRLLRDESLRQRLGQAAATTMTTHYRWAHLAQRAEEAYDTRTN